MTVNIPSLDATINLFGEIDRPMFDNFYEQLKSAQKSNAPIILTLTTSGGEADTARRIALEIKILREKKKREIFFLGKTTVYSAGTVIMSAFPRQCRFLTNDTVLLIHERRIERDVKFDGPMRNNIETAEELLAEFRNAQMLEKRDYAALAEGSNLTANELSQKAMTNWYVTANEALKLGLIEGVI